VKPETQNRRLDPTGLAKPGETRRLMGTGPGLARQELADRVSGRIWNWTDPFLRSKPGPLAGYPDPLLSVGVNLEAMMVRTWRVESCEFRDTLGGCDRASLEMHFDAMIERVWRFTWRLWSSEFGDALGGNDRAGLEEYYEAVNLEAVVQEGGATGAETVFIG